MQVSELDELKQQQAKIGDLLYRGDHEGAQLAIKRYQRLLKKNLPTHQARPPKSDRPRCGAMTRKGKPCMMAALWLPCETQPRNGKCRLHGGLSTGPNTAAGKAAIVQNNKRRAALIRAARGEKV
ncbi:MAG: HGGxSTG domain-containing protein [Thermoleophilia bacterium]